MKDLFIRFVRDESGVAAVEYGLICALIAVPIAGAARDAGIAISRVFNILTDAMK